MTPKQKLASERNWRLAQAAQLSSLLRKFGFTWDETNQIVDRAKAFSEEKWEIAKQKLNTTNQ